MDTFTISAAARLCHCDRRTLQRAIHAGRLHLDAQHCLPREELLAAGYLVIDTPQGTPPEASHETPQYTPHDTPQNTPPLPPQGAPQETPLLMLLERLASAIADLTQEVRQLHAPQAMPHSTSQDPLQTRPHETPQSTPHGAPQETPQAPPQASPQLLGTYDAQAAVARIQTLRRQGLSMRAIAGQLTAEGVPTRHGQPWHQSSVRHLLKTYGEG